MPRTTLGLQVLFVVAVVGPLFAPGGSRAGQLVRDGVPRGAIQYREGDGAEVAEAAEELAGYFQKMTAAQVPVRGLAAGETPERGVVLGRLAEELGLRVEVTTVSREAFRIRSRGDQVLIAGESPVAVRHGSYKLLELLGVRWFTPGALGECVPRTPTIDIGELDLQEAPDAPYRRFWYGGKVTAGDVLLWNKRNRNAGYRGGSFRHAWAGLVPRELFDRHPEYFGLNEGRRTTRQLCTAHPEVARIAARTLISQMDKSPDWIFPAGPNDGGGLCQCEACSELDTPDYLEPSSGLPNCSDRILDFANRLAALTSREHPDRLISFLVYSEYSRIPQRVTDVHPNVIPMIAPIRRCRLHGPDNPICPSNQLLGDEIRGWAAMSRQLGFYPYNYNLADALLPFSKVSAYKRYQQVIRELQLTNLAWDCETLDAWSIYAPHLYLSARLMWDIDLDIDATMQEFYERFYGPAAAPMRAYWESLDAAYDQTPVHAGSYFDVHLIFTPQRLAAWEQSMSRAVQAAEGEPYRSRVAMAAAGLQSAQHFVRIRTAMNACRFQEARDEKQRLFAHLEAMAANRDPDWTHTRYSQGYFQTFLGRTIEGGAAVLDAGGRIVLALPDQWRFATDERDQGRSQGWFTRDFDDSGWRLLKTYSASWEEQGLGGYKRRPAWYRVTVEAPTVEAPGEGRELHLWFGGIDESAEVYVNGQRVGESRGFARPFEFEVTGVWREGQKNLIAVRCLSEGLAELGTGGILRPVMLYVPGREPAKPAGSPAENYEK